MRLFFDLVKGGFLGCIIETSGPPPMAYSVNRKYIVVTILHLHNKLLRNNEGGWPVAEMHFFFLHQHLMKIIKMAHWSDILI